MGVDASVFRTTVRIPTASGDDLEAWVYQPDGHGPHPAVVMAHGFAGVKAGGLEPFAERFCRERFTAVAFDYRHWGGSSGEPREVMSIPRQREDYRTVIDRAAANPDIDTKRIFIWGTSFSGMHVVETAATDVRLRGAIASARWLTDSPARIMCRSLDCCVCSRSVRSTSSVRWSDARRSTSPRARRLASSAQSLPRMPSRACRSLLPPTARTGRTVSLPALYSVSARNRPVRKAADIRCPILLIVAETDTIAPIGPALRVADRASKNQLYRSRGGHYGPYKGGEDHDNVVRVEVEFLHRHAALSEI